ncbi:hypothetical protein HMPREF1861_01648 [Corynebacterium kroppenstedtii]|nr:hypothetical protein HMPREF1861_01648 [Corynebacterium kroppenstedtii]
MAGINLILNLLTMAMPDGTNNNRIFLHLNRRTAIQTGLKQPAVQSDLCHNRAT